MSQEHTCVCGLPRPYAECCEPLHRNERSAPTAEALMRSRYAAFARGEIDYLIRTLHPSKRGARDRQELEQSVKAFRWVGLTIREVVAGQETDDTGIVAFEADYLSAGVPGVLQERSRFVREAGQWFYVDGDVSDRARRAPAGQGRNEACACGSGKKFKRCCGARP
jgi:SEC-C motif-containing protein